MGRAPGTTGRWGRGALWGVLMGVLGLGGAGRAAYASSAESGSPSAVAGESEREYRVEGVPFVVLGRTEGGLQRLGETRLPWAGRSPPLIRGRAAYVRMPGRGVAVVDIGLSRFPYVAWRLVPQQDVVAMRFEGGRLLVTTERRVFEFDVRDPLQPEGQERYAQAPRRHYSPDADVEPISDGVWQDQGMRWGVTGRRLYLRSGGSVTGAWQGTTERGVTLEILGQQREFAAADIVHSEPVVLTMDDAPGAEGKPAATAVAPSPPSPTRMLLITGAVLLVAVQVVAIGVVVVAAFGIARDGYSAPGASADVRRGGLPVLPVAGAAGAGWGPLPGGGGGVVIQF